MFDIFFNYIFLIKLYIKFLLIFASIMYEYPLNLSISLSGGKETK